MNSTNFLIAVVDPNFNMFKVVNDEIQFIDKIAEHIKRLEEISENHHFYIDEYAFAALGKKNFPLRFTRVFTSTPEKHSLNKTYRFHHIDELQKIVMSKERAAPNTQIFFIGSSEFLMDASRFAKKLLITQVDRDHKELKTDIIDVFPINFMKEKFFKRRDIHPEMLEQIKMYRKIVLVKQDKTKVTIADNGMKLIEPNEDAFIDPADEILNTPDYMFYEFSR